ncbi:Universal stress protein family protein [Limimonas halophila]|uniref:Universal stress protein family protein n=1 Tax=Limimonas halophila TaxID=1082479 RepID=A0A1G7T168_9PROT|nr:universal stress protein [Limimonas halophila]SDG29063.1 Universal stress protein family protein [Limimonas halophila]
MTYKNLLLHLDTTDACAQRTDAAVALAARSNAHLTGLMALGSYQPPAWLQMPQSLIDQRRQAEQEAYQKIKADMEKRAHSGGIQSDVRWSNVSADIVGREVGLHARYSDMAIVGQPNPDDPGPLDHHDLGEVVVSSGRPTLVIPYIGARTEHNDIRLGKRVMVAWDASREAARAVNDAMPLLEKADQVDVLVANAGKDSRKHGDEPGADIALHLARHGIHVEVHRTETRDVDVGNVILSRLSDLDSDLLVMGGYAHSRMQELVLGGATRTMLHHMTVPVLLSH